MGGLFRLSKDPPDGYGFSFPYGKFFAYTQAIIF